MKPHFFRNIAVLAAMVLLSNCASTEYSKVKDSAALRPAEGKGLVLIYWDKKAFTKDAKGFNVYASTNPEGNDRKLTSSMAKGMFYSLPADPGYLRISARPDRTVGRVLSSVVHTLSPFNSMNIASMWTKDSVVLSVAAGETYFVSVRWLRMKSRPELRVMTEEEGRKEIWTCRWLNPRG